MLIKPATDIPSSEITSETVYLNRHRNRREFMKTGFAFLAGVGLQSKGGPYDTTERQTPYEYATGYNNYYEFGTSKEDPARYAGTFKVKPWTVRVEGLVKNPTTYNLDDLIKGLATEDRIYRMRCVEGWAMVIPWRGFPLAELIKRLEPSPSAKYVEFKTILAPDQMRGQQSPLIGYKLKWPYTEGLRLDEAMHPLTLIATGMYGKPLPNQNGAPLRLVVPWKYGFKGIKAIERIRFTDKQPVSSWTQDWPAAYGFYSNVNPRVDHPNHSQAREQRIGESWSLFAASHPTLMFNGYEAQVASMYSGMDLRKNY